MLRHNKRFEKKFETNVKKQINAFSLIEFLFALAISAYLIGLFIQQYTAVKHHTSLSATSLETTFDQAMIAELMSNAIMQAGYTPCSSFDRLEKPASQPVLQQQRSIRKTTEGQGGLEIVRMSENFSTSNRIDSRTRLWLEQPNAYANTIKIGDPILIVDCFHAELNHVQSFYQTSSGRALMLREPLHFNYIPPVYIGDVVVEHFFVDKNQEKQAVLYYKTKHKEVLSKAIIGMSIIIKQQRSTPFVMIDFLTATEQTWQLKTAVRI